MSGLDIATKIVAALGVMGGIWFGWSKLRSDNRAAVEQERRTHDEDRRAEVNADRQRMIDERAAAAAEREQWRKDTEALLDGYKAIFDEMRGEFERMRRLVNQCEDQHAVTTRDLMTTRDELRQVREELQRVLPTSDDA